MFNLGSSYFHVALTTVRHLLNVSSLINKGQRKTINTVCYLLHRFTDIPLRIRDAKRSTLRNRNLKLLCTSVFWMTVAHKPWLLDVAAQLNRSPHAALSILERLKIEDLK